MAERSLWFESHLFADSAGRRAHARATQLGTEAHDRILVIGDHLATTSAAVAQQFYRHAPALWQAVGAHDFARWVELGKHLLTVEPANRDAALAYFSVSPKTVLRGGVATLEAWCAIGCELAAVSRRLGATFFESTVGLVARVSAETLSAWARQALRLHGTSGWRGEFLAQAYLASADKVLPVLSPDEFRPWADLGAALQPVLKESQFFSTLPEGCTALTPAERQRLLTTALAIATINAPAAAAVYTRLPAAVRRLHSSARDKVLQVFQLAGPSVAVTLPDIVPVVGALIQGLPRDSRLAALDLALDVARSFPHGSVALLRSLPAAYEEAAPAAVARWVRRGLQIAAENPDAGTAYFALESRTSLKILQASSTAAVLSEVQGLLRKYVRMLSAQSVSIRAADTFSLRPPLEAFPLENEVALPLRIDFFDTHEDNVRIYLFLAAQLAGRREFGTYTVTLPPDTGSDLLAFLRAPDQPHLLEELFLLAEGFRVTANLTRTYPGLAREQRALARHVLSHQPADEPPSQSGLMDALLLWLVSGVDNTQLPAWLRSLAAVVAPCVAPLANRDATANDSLAIAQLLVEQLTEPGERRPQGSLGDLFLDKLTGDALLDQYIYDEAEALPGDGNSIPLPPPTPTPSTLPDDMKLELQPDVDDTDAMSSPLSADELQKLIEAGADLRMKQGYSEDIEGLGLYITDLIGKLPSEQLDELRQLLKEATTPDRPAVRRWLEQRSEGAAFYYDEWDYHIGDYRQRWCRLREIPIEGDSGEFFTRTLADYASLIPEVRRQFQRIRPEMYRTVRGLEDGEDFDLNAVVSARVDRRARRAPSSKLYVARTREERDVATLFLIDMSASTDEPLQKATPPADSDDDATFIRRPTVSGRRIIDVTKEALVIMAEALEEIGDAYAIYGFSGHGRQNVEFYLVKAFNEPLSAGVRGRIGALEPKRSTRMGTALRHSTEKMASITSRSRHLILLSDGFPQDFDYGQDRRSNVYGLRDTTVALREVEAAGITPFCITVDKAGHDYLREMCDGSRYMVIEDIAALPHELPKIYQRVVTT